MALDALTQENSKLYELWQESDECCAWVCNINEFKEKLKNVF